jgi:hypothetical protein
MTRTGPTLAPAPGTRKAPGTGANAAPGTRTHPPDIFDPPDTHAAASAFIRAKDGYLIKREHDNRQPDLFAATTLDPDAYTTWLDHVWPAAACARPIRLMGDIHRVDARTGEVLTTTPTSALPDGIIYKACGNRRARSCPACAETYRRDAFHLIRAGLIGGKGVPPEVAAHPAVFATFTAPSFGAVHTRPIRRHSCASRADCRCQPQPCHARRDTATCEHGHATACFTRHGRDDPQLGQPLCLDCYDHAAQVVWNNNTGELWRRTKQAIERHLNQAARHRGLRYGVRVSHGKAAEYQARGAVHYHALLRLDGLDEHDPDRLLPPPPGITVVDLEEAVRHAAATITYLTPPHIVQPSGWLLGWGDELDVRVITMRGPGTITDLMVASYLAKYSTKGAEVTGHASARITAETIDLYADSQGSHVERLIHAAWTLGTHEDYRSLRRWAHMLGFGGHFFTKSDYYSLRFLDLRQARITYRRSQDTGPEHKPIRTADHTAEETTLIVGTLTYAGTGWRTTGDALLANTAADRARKRREAGREELADEYNCTTGRQAA